MRASKCIPKRYDTYATDMVTGMHMIRHDTTMTTIIPILSKTGIRKVMRSHPSKLDKSTCLTVEPLPRGTLEQILLAALFMINDYNTVDRTQSNSSNSMPMVFWMFHDSCIMVTSDGKKVPTCRPS